MAFKKLNANAPPDAELWNRGQLNIEQAFAEFASPLNVRRIFSSASVKQEMVLASDRYLIVDARGGPIRIVLPVPAETQAVTIKNATASTNAVTIVQADGKAMGDGEQSIAVTAHAAVRMV